MIGLRSRVEELAQDPTARAVAIGVTAVALTPVILPLVKPALKSTLKTSVLLFERTKAAISETGELIADIAAEARAEAMLEAQKSLQLKSADAIAQTSTPPSHVSHS
jgi:hypothetical protein